MGKTACIKGIAGTELRNCDGAASFLQTGFWGTFKARFGWEALPFLADWEGGGEKSLLVIRRPLGPGLSFAYVPWGPELPGDFSPEQRNAALGELAGALKARLPGDTAFIRFDPPWYGEGGGPPPEKPFRRAAADVQCPDTALVDLSPSEGEILAAMKPKWRYNIRLAEKKGVQVRRAGEEELPAFYALLQETARRDGIAVHHLDYYRCLFSLSRDYGPGGAELRLYLASHEGDVLGGIVSLFRGREAVYLYGASSGLKRNLMAPYALQWRVMGDAKAAGCVEYDLFGIPPTEDPAHPMAGLYLFKTGFGGRIVHRPGSWDYPSRPLAAAAFHTAETLRKAIRDRRKRSRTTGR